MKFAERADDVLRAEADRARAAGMEPGRRLGDDLYLVGGEAEGVEESQLLQIIATCAGARYGSGASNTDRTTLNSAVFAPMPSASVPAATIVKPGRRMMLRSA
jgi:hypothetical protein